MNYKTSFPTACSFRGKQALLTLLSLWKWRREGEEKAGRVTQRATSSQPSASFFFRNGIKTGPQEFLCVSNFSPTWAIARHHRPMSSLRQIIEDGTGNRVWEIINSLRPLLFRYLEAPGEILLPPTVKRRPVSIWSSSPFLPPLFRRFFVPSSFQCGGGGGGLMFKLLHKHEEEQEEQQGRLKRWRMEMRAGKNCSFEYSSRFEGCSIFTSRKY